MPESRLRLEERFDLKRVGFSVLCIFLMGWFGSCQPPKEGATRVKSANKNATGLEWNTSEIKNELVVVLGSGSADTGTKTRSPAAETRPLSDAKRDDLLGRLPPLSTAKAEEFALREASKPPPKTGDVVTIPFPATSDEVVPDVDEEGPLRVVRFAPEGDVSIAPHVSITFNQPMVPLSSQAVVAKTVPVTLSPQVDGEWIWLGTKTLQFKPKTRLPMATEYTVQLNEGVVSQRGSVVDEAFAFSFRTPPVRLTLKQPQHGPQTRRPTILLGFNQQINPSELVSSIQLKVGRESFPFRIMTDHERVQDLGVQAISEQAIEGTWMAIQPKEELDKGSRVSVQVDAGAPSAEGPLVTKTPQTFEFSVHSALKSTRSLCGWNYNRRCRPTDWWTIEFNNPLDAEAFDPEWVSIEPDIKRPFVSISGNSVRIGGEKTGNTTYTVTIPKELTDTFGQTLGADETHSFKVDQAEPMIDGPRREFMVLDPEGARTFPIYTVNRSKVRLKVHAVDVDDRLVLAERMEKWRYRDANPPELPGRELVNTRIDIKNRPDERVETNIDLTPYLNKGLGQLLVWVEAEKPESPWDQNLVWAWVQSTQLAASAHTDQTKMYVWATHLRDGASATGAEVELYPHGTKAVVDEDGLAVLPLPEERSSGQMVIVRHGDDVALLPGDSNVTSMYYGNGWQKKNPRTSHRWFVFDDRGMYKPGETVKVKGWVRGIEKTPTGDVVGVTADKNPLSWRIVDPYGNEYGKGTATVTALGGFDFEVALPKTVNLGESRLKITGPGLSGTWHNVSVQEFRRPEYEVNAVVDKGPHLLGQPFSVQVNAAYFSGGALPSASTLWSVHTSAGSFTPPNQDKYSFGAWRPWWRSYSPSGGKTYQGNLSGKTDPLGNHFLDVHLKSLRTPSPINVHAEASVEDVNRQRWTASASVLVHPSERYVGLRMDKSIVEAKKAFTVEGIVVDLDGTAIQDVPVVMTLARLQWKRVNGQWTEVPEELDVCRKDSELKAIQCTFKPNEGATYRIEATVRDAAGRSNVSTLRFWVPGGSQKPERTVALEEVMLIPSMKHVSPGDALTIMVQAPFYPAEGLLTLRRNGLVKKERFTMSSATHELVIDIDESHLPNLVAQVDLVGAATRVSTDGTPLADVPKRPAFATGTLPIKISTASRALSVAVSPKDRALSPGESTTLKVSVTDAAGQGVSGAEMAVLVVDESILSLSGYTMSDPMTAFYATRSPGMKDHRFRGMVRLEDPELIAPPVGPPDMEEIEFEEAGAAMDDAQVGAAPMVAASEPAPPPASRKISSRGKKKEMKGGRESRASSPSKSIRVRTNFNALAHYAPKVRTDASGTASIKITLPDNLTRYRVMVVAVAGDKQFGKGESSITARLPIMLRPSPPRFLNFGDVFELPLVIQNQTDKPREVMVAARASNLGFVSDVSMAQPGGPSEPAMGRTVMVPANNRVEVRLPATTVMSGTAKFQAAFSSGSYTDAASFELPIWTPATTEAFATYGEIDDALDVQTVQPPPDVWPQFGGLEVSTSSTQLQALTDAVIYLSNYPYDCNEQRASRMLAIAALRKVLSEFDAKGLPSPEALNQKVEADIAALKLRQNSNGGFAFWRRGDPSWPYLTIHVTHSLIRAKEMNYAVPDTMIQRALRYLVQIERYIPHWYSERSKRAIRAYALSVRTLAGDVDGAEAKRILKGGLDTVSLETLGWVLPTLNKANHSDAVADIERFLMNKVSETTGTAHFVTQYEDGAHVLLHSSRRADGVLLDALIQVDPDNDLIAKLVRGLLAHRVKGRWASTQENAFVLLAMDRYFKVYEGTTPDFVSRVWLGEAFAGQHTFKGRTTETARTQVPMSYVSTLKEPTQLVLQKDGAGRMYYRLGMNYAPKSLKLDPMDRGFSVLRTYEAVDNEDDVVRQEDGTWRIQAGASVRVRVQMVTPGRRYHVALVDPLPAGLEVLNPALSVTGTVPDDPKDNASNRYWWWSRPWYSHQNMRDERVEAFSTLVWGGVHEYTYVARATTPGTFVVPPAKAEEMYAPETFGRSASDRVIVAE